MEASKAVNQMDDQQLWATFRKGDESAMNTLFLRYYSVLCAYARQYVEQEDARDLVQNLMIWLWENREMLVIETNLRTYLFSAVRNSCLTQIHKNEIRRQAHNEFYQSLQNLYEDPDYYNVEELSLKIEEAIAALPETYRIAFVKNRFEQMTYKQIAQEAGVSPKTIDYRITQALKLLRTALKDYLPVIGFFLV